MPLTTGVELMLLLVGDDASRLIISDDQILIHCGEDS